MPMKTLFSILLLFCIQLISAQEANHKTVLEAPESWRPEIIEMPLSFAPSLDYKGFEDIRFAPGWADTTASDYFTYTFTWVLDKNPKLNQKKLETQTKAYFDGLMAAVSERNDLPKTEASFEFSKVKTAFAALGDVSFYEAFFSKKVITLKVLATGEKCKATGKYLVRFNLSPSTDKATWEKMDEVKLKVDCGK